MQKLPTHKKEYDTHHFLIAEGPVYKEKKNGFWIEYYPQKIMSEKLRVKARGFYKDDEKIGIWHEYNYFGMLKGYGQYLHNEKVNRWHYFDNKGRLVASFLYPIHPIKFKKISKQATIKKTSFFVNLFKSIFSHQNQ